MTFVADLDQPHNRLLRMKSSTNGTATRLTLFCHQRKYLDGTYATRMRFSARPVAGPDRDQVPNPPLDSPFNF